MVSFQRPGLFQPINTQHTHIRNPSLLDGANKSNHMPAMPLFTCASKKDWLTSTRRSEMTVAEKSQFSQQQNCTIKRERRKVYARNIDKTPGGKRSSGSPQEKNNFGNILFSQVHLYRAQSHQKVPTMNFATNISTGRATCRSHLYLR